jgi:hypothetical protein
MPGGGGKLELGANAGHGFVSLAIIAFFPPDC